MATLRNDKYYVWHFKNDQLPDEQFDAPIGHPRVYLILEWPAAFEKIYSAAVRKYEEGARRPVDLFASDELAFLESIGCSAQELYDFVEDWCELGEPSFDVVGRVTAARRQYFLSEQKSQRSSKVISSSSLPSKEARLGDFVWLPRIIAKARAKLRGELPQDIMYGCGADRSFLRRVGIDPAEFLGVVWSAGDDDHKILDYISLKPS